MPVLKIFSTKVEKYITSVIFTVCFVYLIKKIVDIVFYERIRNIVFGHKTYLTFYEIKLFKFCFRKELVEKNPYFFIPVMASTFITFLPLYGIANKKAGRKQISSDFIETIARRASDDAGYREILLHKSLENFFEGTYEERIKNKMLRCPFIPVRGQRDRGQEKLAEALKKTKRVTLTYFNVTGQSARLGKDIPDGLRGKVRHITLFCASPLLCSHTAIKNLCTEHNACHDIVDMRPQLIEDIRLDFLRRSLKILANIHETVEMCRKNDITLEIYCFTTKHPRVKLILIHGVYGQFRVGGLPYPNNLYRFGFEMEDENVMRPFVAKVEALKKGTNNSSTVERLSMDAEFLTHFQERALKEAVDFLIDAGISPLDFKVLQGTMLTTFSSEDALQLYRRFLKMFMTTFKTIKANTGGAAQFVAR